MLPRYESRHRNYTELCNRSSSGSCGLAHVAPRMSYSSDTTVEDYWEDASVSLRSCRSWEPPSTPWLGASSTPSYVKVDAPDENKRFPALGSPQTRPHRYSCDEHMTCTKGRRSFPPPLASCSTLSIKEGGRFVLKEMDVDRPQGFFRAQRGNGRLRLQLVLPDEVMDEEDDHEESLSHVEDTTESQVEISVKFVHADLEAHGEETTTSNQEGCSSSDEEVIRSISNDNGGVCGGGHVYEIDDFEAGRAAVQGVGSEGIESNACSTSQDVGMDVRCATLDTPLVPKLEGEAKLALEGFYSSDPHQDISACVMEAVFLEADNFLSFGKLELNQLVAESSISSSIEQEPLWNVDVSKQALASLSPWSPKQLCLHQPIVNMRPAFGLAMS